MKTKNLRFTTMALLPAAALTLTGCWTAPTVLAPESGNPSLVGSMVVVQNFKTTATVESIDATERKVVLKRPDGVTTTLKAGPNVVNFDQIQVGDEVTANATGESAIFLVRNGPLPSAGAGVLVMGAAKGDVPAGMLLATQDFSARVIGVDRSYRLLTLEYVDGKTKTFKIPLPYTLEHVEKGDNVVVRTTVDVALRLKKNQSAPVNASPTNHSTAT